MAAQPLFDQVERLPGALRGIGGDLVGPLAARDAGVMLLNEGVAGGAMTLAALLALRLPKSAPPPFTSQLAEQPVAA